MNANSATSPRLISLADVEAARRRIGDHVHRTPVLTSEQLDALTGATLFFKCENLQHVGAFKARGAANAVLALSDAEAAKGVATHSSGNHAAAVARAAALRGAPAYIVMPEGAAQPKVEQVERLGGLITFCAPTQRAREETAARIVADTDAVFIHPYDNPLVIAGQGTAGLELLEDVPDLDLVLAPIGGGGLISGVSTVVRALAPTARVVGCEPAGADDAARSLQAGRLIPLERAETIADGLRASLAASTFAHIQRGVDAIATVTEPGIVTAMRTLWEALRVIVEPSAAAPYAAILEGKVEVRDLRVGVIVTGGNVDLDRLPWIVG